MIDIEELKAAVDADCKDIDAVFKLRKAAKELIALREVLEPLIEARDRAAQGKWWIDNGITVEGSRRIYGITLGAFNDNTMFAVLAANTMQKIKEIVSE